MRGSGLRDGAAQPIRGSQFGRLAGDHGRQGEVTTEAIHVNAGLRAQDLAAKPPDFAPDIPR
jgi:hypothetical protein